MPPKSRIIVPAGVALIVIATSFAYFPALHGGFLMDDDILLTNNSFIKSPSGVFSYWYSTRQPDYVPLTSTTLWLEWRLWGMDPTGYHVTNLILHLAACLLIWRLLNRMSIPGGFLAAQLYAVHPVNVESVAWVEQRKNTLSLLFFLLSILWYLRADEKRKNAQKNQRASRGQVEHGFAGLGPWYWLSLLAFALAMFSKGSVAILPLLLLWIVWWMNGQVTKWDLFRTAPFFLLTVVMTPVIIWFVTQDSETVRNATFVQRLLQAGAVIWFYLSKAIVPIELIFVYRQWLIQTGNLLWWLPLAAVAVVSGVLIWQRRRRWGQRLLFAWGFFCVALLPVAGFTDPGYMRISLVADHYQYIAILSVIALVAATLTGWHQQAQGTPRATAAAVIAILVVLLTLLTHQQCQGYGNPVELYQATLEKNPECWMAHVNLGIALDGQGKIQESIAHFVEAIKIKPDLAEAHFNLGNCLSTIGQPQRAIEEFRRALELQPIYPDAHTNLAIALASQGQMQEAIEQYQQAVQENPDSLQAQNNLGNALARVSRFEEAITHLEAAVRLQPDSAKIQNNLGATLADLGRFEEAIGHYQTAIQLDPGYAQAYFNLAKASAKLDRSAEAIAAAERGLAIARNAERTALVQQIESWLKNYQASLPNSNETTPPKLTPSAP